MTKHWPNDHYLNNKNDKNAVEKTAEELKKTKGKNL